MFDSLLAASICCHRDRHRCNIVVHACLQPTRVLYLKADLNFCVRPSGRRLRIATNYFSDHFLLRFSKISDQRLLRKRSVRKKVIRKRVFLTHTLECLVVIRKKKFSITFFWFIRVGLFRRVQTFLSTVTLTGDMAAADRPVSDSYRERHPYQS